jgi:hypothetical protein
LTIRDAQLGINSYSGGDGGLTLGTLSLAPGIWEVDADINLVTNSTGDTFISLYLSPNNSGYPLEWNWRQQLVEPDGGASVIPAHVPMVIIDNRTSSSSTNVTLIANVVWLYGTGSFGFEGHIHARKVNW